MNQQPLIPHGAPISGSSPLPIAPPEHLWDRDALLAALYRDLKVGTAVLLHGPSGIGKTALAAALAADYLADGVLWIEATDDSIRSLLNRAVRAYGVDPASFEDSSLDIQLQVIRDLLHRYRPFIVLDGQVNVDAAREFVRSCASGIPLVLTQTKLAAGPWTPHEVGPLSISATIEMLGTASGSAPELSQLAEILAGHPLAITIARRHLGIRGINPPDFWAQIAPVPPGEANRAAGVLMAAYRLLPSTLQGLLLLVGASFTESISEELLSDVAGAPVNALRPAVAQLVARGLISERASGCYVIYELVQAFAQASLGGKKQATQDRHLRAVLTYIRRHADEPDHLADEIETILAAGLYAAQNNQPDTLRELTGLLDSFASQRGFTQEITWLESLLEQPDLADQGFLGQAEPITEIIPELEIAREEANSLFSEPLIEAIPQPETAASQQDVIETSAPVEEDTALQEPLSDAELEELELDEEPAAEVVRPAPPTTEAAAQYSQALDSYQANGSIEDELAALQALAELNLQQENVAGVLDYIDKGMALAQQSDNPRREGELLIILGDLQTTLGRYQGAEDAYREAISALRPVEAWDDIADTLEKLGDVYLLQDRSQDTASVWEQTVPIFERSNRQAESVQMLGRLSDLYADQLQWREAIANRTRALEQARTPGR